jgi:hypothetical protein
VRHYTDKDDLVAVAVVAAVKKGRLGTRRLVERGQWLRGVSSKSAKELP